MPSEIHTVGSKRGGVPRAEGKKYPTKHGQINEEKNEGILRTMIHMEEHYCKSLS